MKKKLLTRSINTIVIASALSLLTGCSGSGGTDSIVDDIEAELENISNGDSSDTDTSDADSSESDETENSDSSTMDDETATAFPSDLAVASPTDVESNSTTASITSSGVKSLALKNHHGNRPCRRFHKPHQNRPDGGASGHDGAVFKVEASGRRAPRTRGLCR